MFSELTLPLYILNDLQYDSDPQTVQTGLLFGYIKRVHEELQESDLKPLMLSRDPPVHICQHP